MTVTHERAPHLWPRALAATVLVMAGATGAHTWAGGHRPSGPALVALGTVVLGGSLVFLRGLATWRLLLPVVAVAQTGLHGVFGLLGDAGGHAGHTAAGGAPVTDVASWSWQMLLAHALGTLLTAAVWCLADRAVRTLLGALPAPAPCATHRRPTVSGPATPARPSLVHLLAVPRRGPPAATGLA